MDKLINGSSAVGAQASASARSEWCLTVTVALVWSLWHSNFAWMELLSLHTLLSQWASSSVPWLLFVLDCYFLSFCSMTLQLPLLWRIKSCVVKSDVMHSQNSLVCLELYRLKNIWPNATWNYLLNVVSMSCWIQTITGFLPVQITKLQKRLQNSHQVSIRMGYKSDFYTCSLHKASQSGFCQSEQSIYNSMYDVKKSRWE